MIQFMCACSDPGCPVHRNRSVCSKTATTILRRVDMNDRTGTPMCGKCASDALDSGLFVEDVSLFSSARQDAR